MLYHPILLPVDSVACARQIMFERAQGGHLYTQPNGSVALVRDTWPPITKGLLSLDVVPDDWTEISA